MSRLILLVLIAGVVLAVVALVMTISTRPAGDGAVTQPRRGGIQKVAYIVLIAVLFGTATGLLGDG